MGYSIGFGIFLLVGVIFLMYSAAAWGYSKGWKERGERFVSRHTVEKIMAEERYYGGKNW